MHITTDTTTDGVVERLFTLDGITGVIWSPEIPTGETRLLLSGHSGGMHKKAPGLVANALHSVSRGFTVAAIDAPGHGDRPRNAEDQQWADAIHRARDAGQPLAPIVTEYNASLAQRAVPEWQATIDALHALPEIGAAPIGFGGMTLGVATGLLLAAVEPRIAAVSFGPVMADDVLRAAAEKLTIPVEFTIAWDDEHIDRTAALTLFDVCGSADKSVHVYPGTHTRMTGVDPDRGARFFERYLG